MPVSTLHPEYQANLHKWELVKDCVKGSDAVKERKEKYLPKPNPEDSSDQNARRYTDYVKRANFVNFTGSTLEGLLGMAFKNPVITDEIQSAIEYITDNADGNGITIDQLARSLVSKTLQAGRHGLLVEYPEAPEGLSKAQQMELNLQANILSYPAESVINWECTMVGGVKMLSLVVLKEDKKVPIDDFENQIKQYHRVLQLVDGVYMQFMYNDNDELIPEETKQPRKADGSFWTEIPFVFIGSENNDEKPDKSPLYDIAEVNVAHYRNSADFEDSCYMVGQPTPFISGLSQSWVDTNMSEGIMLGSRAAVLLPEGGNMGIVQAGENIMPERGMAAKEVQMVKLGARIIEDTKGNETAEAARIRFGGQNSKLATVVGNVESALNKCLEWVSWFMGSDMESEIKLNREFYDKSIDPQLIMAEIQLMDRGVIAMSDIRKNLRTAGIVEDDRSDDEIDNEAEISDTGMPA